MTGETTGDEPYYRAARETLLRDIQDPTSLQSLIDMVTPLRVRRVLDVGCGIGQSLFPLAISQDAMGVGVDIARTGCRMGREFYAAHFPAARIRFLLAQAESLPFASDSFDVVNCGLALPYTNNARALAEVARVLRPGGLFLLRIHHLRFYLSEMKRALLSRQLLMALYFGRVLTAGTIYHLTRRQPGSRFLSESYQTRWLLTRELAKQHLVIEGEQSNTNPLTPAFVIYKKQ